ncbi:MAG: 1-acyl-sn-glycerol-3-phosphate acyltransferase [Bacteroidota bacterium]
MSKLSGPTKPVIERIEDWPIYRLSEDREAFVQQIDEFTVDRLMQLSNEQLQDIIVKTIYLERIRIKEEPWKVDPPNERQFWGRIRKHMVRRSLDKNDEESRMQTEEILRRIVNRYSEEIVGTFKIPTFRFARRFLTLFFNRLLNTAASRNLSRIWSTRHRVSERFNVVGDIDQLRKLATKGTLVVVPTHSSNLDSIMIGYVLDLMGFPSFSYGAGLNLYNTGYTAYFMNRLGAYRIDRRKKNPIYLETLKGMSNLSIQRGTNSLFFPGGTRCRSGNIENKLKMGMLGTVVEAQRAICERGEDNKLIIVPLILCYHSVLEAKYLIDQHLKRTGKEQYIDYSYSRRKVLSFMWRLFSASSKITLSFGKPMDVLGNFVNEAGESFDRHGHKVEIADYFVSDGEIRTDLQREQEYTRILAKRIVRRYHRDNVVLSSHLVAFSAFNILRHTNPNLDLYGLLRLPEEEYIFNFDVLKKVVSQLRDHLLGMEKNGQIKLSRQIRGDVEELIRHGMRNLGIFHPTKPLHFAKSGQLVSQDFKLLYYYHNRLENYQLEKVIQWKGLDDGSSTAVDQPQVLMGQ